MRIGISTSVVQRGKSGVGQYVFALLRSLLSGSHQHKFVLFALEEDLRLFAFAKDKAEIVPVPEKFRPPVNNILWHQMRLPKLVRSLQLDVLHIPSYRRMLGPRPCPRRIVKNRPASCLSRVCGRSLNRLTSEKIIISCHGRCQPLAYSIRYQTYRRHACT